MSHKAGAVLLCAALALAGSGADQAARGQDRPLLVPQRDVDVLYRMPAAPRPTPPDAGSQPAGQPASPPTAAEPTQRLRWLAARRLMRVDPPGSGVFMIIDYADARMQMVETAARAVVDMAAPPELGKPAPDARYERLGEDRIADTPCTVWRTADLSGQPAVVCLTRDGVLLRAGEPRRGLIEASSVRYGPQDPALFEVPQDFRHLAPPRAVPPGALQ